jgi:bifunctional DNase/RNase
MSHDLMGAIISALGARLFTVEITELIDNTYYANLRLLRDTSEIVVSARPSDAVALALRAGAPILVSDTLMNEQGRVMNLDDDDEMDDVVDAAGESDEAELVAELREFLDTIRPEDFNQ